jgi:hypothetical protein
MNLRYPAASKAAGKRVEQGLTIMDLSGGGVTTANSQTKALFQLAAKVGSDYYPEIMGNVIVTNTPMMFTALWAVLKGFLDERTRAKIKLVGSSYKSKLLEYIDDENIPSFLGGKCTCSHHEEGCISSNIGPWNDYLITDSGICLKADIEKANQQPGNGEEEEVKKDEEEEQKNGEADWEKI